MAQTPFIHLRLRTEFSLVDGLVRVKPLIAKAVAQQIPALAITDQCNLFALVRFYKAAMGAGIKPIIGSDLWVAAEDADEPPYLISFLAANDQGYKNLTELISKAYLSGQGSGQPLVEREWVEQLADGLIALSGAKLGDIGGYILKDKPEQAQASLQRWQRAFPGRFYLEVQRTGRVGDEDVLHASVALAQQYSCPLVATNDVRFLEPDQFDAHEARVCIHDGRTIADPRRQRLYSQQQYFRSSDEMTELFADLPEAIENTWHIAQRCSLSVQLGEVFLPQFPIPQGLSEDEYFSKLSEEGLQERLAGILDQTADDYQSRLQVYKDRLKFELDIIIQMEFPGYFLIVMEFIGWAKDNLIPVGPGRGSGAGSLVAYALKITDLDPIEYELLFERFLNPERVSMPDFDIDFCMDGRDRVIAHVADTYGRDAVSQIVTFGTMAAKAVVRDVARVQGKSYGLADKLSKLIPFEVGITLQKALEQEPALKEFVDGSEEVGEIMEMAFQLEGLTRNVGKHAGGVVIAPTKLTDFVPLYCDDQGNNLVTQFDKDDVEQAGLVKFDFLGLKTLTVIDWALETINRKKQQLGEDIIAIENIPLDEPPVIRLLQNCDTTAVFQLESRGMKDLISRLQPDSFEDMIALVALFRPGPLQSGMVDDFINRKHGREEVQFPHPDLEPVLGNTYGVILYQEQVMQIAQVLAKFSLGGADMLRRAMGKKKPEVMAQMREKFCEGAVTNNIDEGLAASIFDLMEKFAGYGFNKSHSAAYALVSYQTAWLKTYYAAPFMAAVLSADMQNTDKVVIFIEDCRQKEIAVLPPDVNRGEFRFTVSETDEIIYGLGAIKGVGEGPIEAIISARQSGPFTSLFDFCCRIDNKALNKRVLEALVRSGALDSVAPIKDDAPHRAALFVAIPDAVKAADQSAKNADAGMMDMFGEVATQSQDEELNDYSSVPIWSDKERLGFEKDTIGLYLTGHPIDEYSVEIKRMINKRIVDVRPNRSAQHLCGLVVAYRTMKSKRGGTIAFITLDDKSARIEVSIFGELYEQSRELIQKDAVLIIEGVVSDDDYSQGIKVRAKSVLDITLARQKFGKGLMLNLHAHSLEKNFIESLSQILQQYQVGHSSHEAEAQAYTKGCPININYHGATAKAALRLADLWRVMPRDELLLQLQRNYGQNCVSMVYR